MDTHQFLQFFGGRWRSQRSDHPFGEENGDDVRSVIEITALGFNDPDLISICQQYDVDPQTVLHPMKVSWEEESLSTNKPNGSALIVPVAINPDSPNKGVILSKQGKSTYEFSTDEALTIKTATAENVIEERIWYGNPNLRFRVTTLLQANKTSDRGDHLVKSSKFYSEIRINAPKP